MCHPDGAGPYPVILFYMDAPGIREELRDMARRLAGMGYYVLLPNLYYRAGVEELGAFIGAANAATRERMFGFMNSLTIPMVMDDTDALLAFAAKDAAASPGPVGCVGYCMSGQYAISAAVRHPDRVTAAASIYGTRLITDQPDSPHLTAPRATAEIYVAWAEIDHYAPLEMLAPATGGIPPRRRSRRHRTLRRRRARLRLPRAPRLRQGRRRAPLGPPHHPLRPQPAPPGVANPFMAGPGPAIHAKPRP